MWCRRPATITDPCSERVSAATRQSRRTASIACVEVALVQRADLGFVREEDVDLLGHERPPFGPVAVDAERVGERQRDFVPRLVRDARGLAVRLLGLGRSHR